MEPAFGSSAWRTPIYLTSISYELGERVPLADLADPRVCAELDNLHAGGLKYCRSSADRAASLGVASAKRTLQRSGAASPEGIIHSTEAFDSPSPTTDMWELLLGLSRPDTPAAVVCGNGCGNLAPAVRAARSLILADGVDDILLVTADAVAEGFKRDARYLLSGNTVMSDGAASCLVTTAPAGPGYRLLGIATVVRADLPPIRSIAGMRLITTVLAGAAESIRAQIGEDARGYDWFVTGNYSTGTRKFLQLAAGMRSVREYAPHVADIAHCFAADQLIALATLADEGSATPGERILLLTTSARSWSLIALEFAAPAGSDA